MLRSATVYMVNKDVYKFILEISSDVVISL